MVERRIIQLTKPKGLQQYLLTLPKDYARELIDRKIRSLIIAYGYGLVAFPNEGERSEAGLLEFLKAHQKLKHFLLEPAKSRRSLEKTRND